MKKIILSQLLIAAIMLCLPLSALAAPAVGIADQRDEAFSAPLFQQLHVKYVRITVPWDAMKPGFAHNEIDAALNNLRRQGIEPLVVVGRSRYSSKAPAPSTSVYQKALASLVANYSWVRYWSPANEPNLSAAISSKPINVASYGKALYTICLKYKCQVTSPAVLDQPNLLQWSTDYKAALPTKMQPKVWLLHNYIDANNFSSSRTKGFLKAFSTSQVWIAETGGLIHGTSPNANKWPKGVAQQDKVFKWLVGPYAKSFPMIKRVYIYQWQGSVNNDWDSGIVDLNGNPRPVYHSIAAYIKKYK